MRCVRQKNDTRALSCEFHNVGRSLECADSSVLEIQLLQPSQPCCWPCPGVPSRLWQVGTEQGVAGGVGCSKQAQTVLCSSCKVTAPRAQAAPYLKGKWSSSSHQVLAMCAGGCHPGKLPSLSSGQKSLYMKSSSQRHLAKLDDD